MIHLPGYFWTTGDLYVQSTVPRPLTEIISQAHEAHDHGGERYRQSGDAKFPGGSDLSGKFLLSDE
jgi:hypothetical protein